MKEHETVRVIPTHIILYDGHEVYTVTAAFYNAVRLQVEESIPGLIHGEKYKSEWLCGNAFWKPLSNDEKRMAGRCIAHMVVTGVLPLRFADSRHEYPNWYRLNHH